MNKIEKYKTETGECPLNDFLLELKNDGQLDDLDKIQEYVMILEDIGNKILSNSNLAKRLDKNLFELRPKANRVLYCFQSKDDKFILLHAFKKKTDKTPPSEIKKAKKEIRDYERRNGYGK